jgi:hypothetical protein
MVFLKVLRLWAIFEMMNSLEIYIIYCMTVVGMLAFSLRLMLRFASVAKARWHGRMLNQFHQRDHPKRTFPTDRVVRASVSGLINIQDTFVTKFHKLKTIYKGVFNGLNWQEAEIL